jgi:peptidoglycan/LPS O-acetylase OafA/YrhL
MDQANRNFGLDLTRAMAILLVLLSHGRGLLPEFPGKELFANGGYFGVELFFVLSGFLIGNILFNLFEDSSSQKITANDIKIFWFRRWFRTLPNYFLFLILNITVFQYFFGSKPFHPGYIVFLQNLAWPCPDFMPESWSLAVEEWFYLLLPVLLLFFTRLIKGRKRALFTGLILYIAAFTIIRFIGASSDENLWDSGVRKVVIYRLDAIGWGVLIAFCQRYYTQFFDKKARTLLIAGGIITFISVIIFSKSIMTSMESYFNKTSFFTMTSVGLSLMLPGLSRLRPPSGWFRYMITHLSIVSYSAYLLHLSFVIPFLARPLFINHLPLYMVYILYLILSVILSTFIYKYFEKPVTAIRNSVAGSMGTQVVSFR